MSSGSYFVHSRLPVAKTRTKTASKGRRSPVQGRSQATVDAVLAAAAQILARHGPEAATTNAIAERAGVSIGTLYQYFADKDALIDVLATRHIEEMEAVLFGALADAGADERGLIDGAERLVAAILAAHKVDPRLHHALHQVLPRKKMSTIDRLEMRMEETVTAVLQAREGLTAAAAERTAVMLVRGLGGMIRTTMRRDPGRLDDPRLGQVMARLIIDCVNAAREAR